MARTTSSVKFLHRCKSISRSDRCDAVKLTNVLDDNRWQPANRSVWRPVARDNNEERASSVTWESERSTERSGSGCALGFEENVELSGSLKFRSSRTWNVAQGEWNVARMQNNNNNNCITSRADALSNSLAMDWEERRRQSEMERWRREGKETLSDSSLRRAQPCSSRVWVEDNRARTVKKRTSEKWNDELMNDDKLTYEYQEDESWAIDLWRVLTYQLRQTASSWSVARVAQRGPSQRHSVVDPNAVLISKNWNGISKKTQTNIRPLEFRVKRWIERESRAVSFSRCL